MRLANVDTLKTVIEELRKDGLGAPPVLAPDQLTTLDNEQFAETYARNHGTLGLYIEALAETRASFLELDAKKRFFESAYALSRKESAATLSKEEVLGELVSSKEYVALFRCHQQLLQRKILLEAHQEVLRRNLEVLSRFVTMRAQDFEHTRVSTNVPIRHRTVRRG